MKLFTREVSCRVVCLLLLVLAAAGTQPALGKVFTAASPAPTSLFHDDFDDTSGLDDWDGLVISGGYLRVPAEVTWSQDTFADFYPGSGVGVDLYTLSGTIILARFTPDLRVNDVSTGPQVQAAAASASDTEAGRQYLYTVWADGRSGDLDIYFSLSTDGGLTWSPGRKLNLVDGAGDQYGPRIATCGPAIHVAWEDAAGVHYTRSPDYGQTWFADSLLVANARAPDLAARTAGAESLVYLVYVADESPGDPDIYARRSANGGATWGSPENVVAGEPVGAVQGSPRIALLAGTDLPWAVWADSRNGEMDLYAGRRTPSGSWSNQRVDAGPAESTPTEPVIFFPPGSGAPLCVWTDDRNGATDLYWARYTSDLQLWEEMGALTGPGAGAHGPAASPLTASSWAGWAAAPPAAYDTAWVRSYSGGSWGLPFLVPDHLPGVTRTSLSIAQADLYGQVVAALWSDDRADAGDIFVSTSQGIYQANGTYTSTVHYFGDLDSWGAISWTGGELSDLFPEVRSGDTPVPDATWSPWTAAVNGTPAPVPPARYLQYRATLARTPIGDTPKLASVSITAHPRHGWATSIPIGHCVAAWEEFDAEGYAPTGTTMTLNLLDITGTVLYSDVTVPFDLSVITPTEYPRLRLNVDMQRTPTDGPVLNWWQVSWEEGRTHAALSLAPEVIYTPTVVQFTNHSTATVEPLSFLWDLGDGFTSTLENPTHTYALAGAYTVTLRASGECGLDVATATLTVLPLPTEPPEAAFSHGPLCPGEEIAFHNESTGAIWWEWNFGDNTTSTLLHPTHVYTAAGDYTLTLAVTNTLGSDQAVELFLVRPAPTAAFTWTSDVLTAAFSATVSGDPALLWSFGDGFTATVPNPTHTYALSGTYTVTLAAANACAETVVTDVVAVACTPVSVVPTFAPANPVPEEVITFTAQVTGSPPLELEWDLGDGTVRWGQVVTHAYALTGTYTATLSARNPCGTVQGALVVSVAYPPPPPPPPPPTYFAYLPVVCRGYYPGDAFEPDDTPAQALLLPMDVPQYHDFAPRHDVDWVYLNLTAGVEYSIRTQDLTGGADTYIHLYTAGAYDAPVRENDDCGDYTRASCLTFTPSLSGRYELEVENIEAEAWGPESSYVLEAYIAR